MSDARPLPSQPGAEPIEAPQPTRRRAPPYGSFPRPAAQRYARLVAAGALVGLGIFVLRGFLGAIGWAVILTLATWPLYSRFLNLFPPHHKRFLAPFLFTFIIALVFVLPLAVTLFEMGRELNALMSWLGDAQHNGIPVPPWLPRLPWIGHGAQQWWVDHLVDPGALSDLFGQVDKAQLALITQEIGVVLARRVTFLAFTVLTLFFVFRDGAEIGRRCRLLGNRALGKAGEHLGEIMVGAVRSTADGLVLVGLGEGAFLAVAYVLLGTPHPALLGALTGILAMIPFGAPVIFGFTALYLLALSRVAAAIGLIVYGFLVVFVADHFFRPALIGGSAKLPFLWVLLGIFGGLGSFGLLGLFLGPAIMAALVALWREWTAGGSVLRHES